MKITMEENAAFPEIEVVIRCRTVDEEVLRLLAELRARDKTVLGLKDGKTYPISAADVLYFDTTDKRTFLYTADAVFETPLRLYEIEERLCGGSFCRAGKSCVVHINKIRSLEPDFGGRLMVTMENGERINVSRQYAGAIKSILGIGKE